MRAFLGQPHLQRTGANVPGVLAGKRALERRPRKTLGRGGFDLPRELLGGRGQPGEPPPGKRLEPKIEEFLRYVLSLEGQRGVEQEGLFLPLPLRLVEQEIIKLR